MSIPSVAPRALALFFLALTVVGCDCRGRGVGQNFGEVGVIWRDTEGNRITSRTAVYDFGKALVGERKQLAMNIRNVGVGRLTLASIERVDGDTVTIGAATVDNAPFEVQFVPQDLLASEQTEYQIFFSPKALKGSFEVTLKLKAEGARPEDAEATIVLKGQGEEGVCEVPDVIDFGKVPLGETLPFEWVLRNPTSIDARGQAGDITGQDMASFGYAPASPRGEVVVPGASNVTVTITFSPTEKRAYEAAVTLTGAGECPTKTVIIRGEGSDEVLSWTPTSLNFGFVSPGFEAYKEVIFVNPASVPIRLTNVAVSNINDYFHAVPAGQNATEFIVPGGGVPTPMRIACNPTGLGPRPGATLTFNTPLASVSAGSVTLSCIGGGPKIKVSPRPNLSFGRVGFFPGNTTFNVTRRVNVQNVGTRPPTPDPRSNLFLGQVSADGTPGMLPLFDLTPKNATTELDEIAVSLGSPYNPSTGLEATAGSNYLDLLVVLSPKTVGLKAAELVIYSNDASEPSVTLTITADVQQLPPCNFRVSPAQADFGLVTPGLVKDLPVNITNLGTAAQDICYLSGIDLAAGSNPAYSIVGGPIVEKELQPRETWPVVVRVAPTGQVPASLQTLAGALLFNVTSPTTPQVSVPLRASVGPSCLAITPDPLDFGTVKLGCSSQSRQFSIYNICSTAMAITGFGMPAPAGQPAGGPNCAGGSDCPEFSLTMTPTIAPGGSIALNPGAAPVTFRAAYKPIDVGADQGAVSITVQQSGQTVTYLVGLQGAGDTTGRQVDTFTQDLSPKADILLVVDDSGSMQDKQTSLAQNFNSFIQYAVAAAVDYHVGVITTTTSTQECVPGFGCIPVNSKYPGGGVLVRDAARGLPSYLTPQTPQVAQKFADAVNVGTNGSGTEEALETSVMALTPPKLTAENAGFLRTDANLAIVVVSDAGDQSAQAVSYYENRLINVKGFNRLSMFTFNAIGPNLANAPSGCTYDGGGDVARYNRLVTTTGGVRDEICTNNWSAVLQGLGQRAFGFRTQFFLNTTPDTSMGRTIEVKVDGVVVPSSTTTWTYDAASSSIKFASTATPGPGQTLTVTYTSACFPP